MKMLCLKVGITFYHTPAIRLLPAKIMTKLFRSFEFLSIQASGDFVEAGPMNNGTSLGAVIVNF